VITLEFVFRSSIILAAGLTAAWSLRKRPAALRHWVLGAAILLAAGQPVITALMPAISLRSVQRLVIESAAPIEVQTDVEAVRKAAPAPVPAASSVNWPRLAYWAWIGGMAASFAVLIVGAFWMFWLGSRGRAAGETWQRAAEDIRSQLGLTMQVRLVVTRHPALLVTWGVIAPVILLPADADTWPADRIRHVVAHEMAHLLRRDWVMQLMTEIARAINWFNPLFWIACAGLRRDSEHACDDIVLDLGFRGTSYASHLLDLARSFSVHGRTWLPAPSIARPSTLERRVRAMLNPQVDRRPVSSLRRVAIAAVLLALTLPIAAASQAGTPSGTVADPMGRPLADAVIRLTPVNGTAVIEAKSDETGAFVFPRVAAGDYFLAVYSPGFSGKRHRMTLNGGAVTISLQVQVGTLTETVHVGKGTGEREVHERPVPASYASAPICDAAAGGQLKPPMKIRSVNPRYKQEWIDAGIEGNILLQATIGKDGRVRSVELISRVNADLEDEALAAVSGWEFSPTYLNCEPIEVQMYVTVSFRKP
jgi:TonB family protein